MSQVRINLQPPPNVDFVTGYPGIPPGSDRPQAAVKGAIEVRLPPQGVKAKWVRIELRKVETLPGGGPANTFYDFVGPSPVNLWSTSDEYSMLRSADFPFSIRIPESIPPTIALDNKAGIGYELVASVCTKGKKGFLQKAKSVVASSISPIIIDKHELHSTWPVYCQPEIRHLAQEGINLVVERNNNCYGPGDRVTVTATLKSDSLHTVILRGFEFYLREATVFRAGVHTQGKKNTPQVKQVNIAETKVPVNATLYGGTSHTAELTCMISPTHTTTTLNAARHIDVTYTLCIKALMGTGTHLTMELPVIISNWQRHVSYEAISRIGPAPSLSLLPPTIPGGASAIIANRIDPARARPVDTLPANRSNVDSMYTHTRTNSGTMPSLTTRPTEDFGYGGRSQVDEFGSNKPGFSSTPSTATVPISTAPVVATTSTTTSRNRPSSAGGGNRFTVKNVEVPLENPTRQRSAQATASGSGSGSASAGPQKHWPSAEEEKELYEQARARVIKVHGVAASPAPVSARDVAPPQSGTSSQPTTANTATSSKSWPSAEEEKRLFQQAQAAAQRTHVTIPPTVQTHTRDNSDPKSSGSGSKPSAAAELYAKAISARSAPAPVVESSSTLSGAGSSSNTSPSKVVPQYLTAEQEKAALRRYEEAKRAVDRTQGGSPPPSNSGPIAYDSLFPSASAGSSSHPPPPADDPPPFENAAGGSNIMAHLSEKERLRRAYEAQDAAQQSRQSSPPPPAAYPAPAPAASPLPGQYANALEEKEAMRKKFEARDNALAARQNPTSRAPPRSNSTASGASSAGVLPSPSHSPSQTTGSRPTPLPPPGARVLSAAEEKALLRAKYEARDAANGNPRGTNGNSSMAVDPSRSAPPPLMPRPPVEYIKETQEQDARLSRLNGEIPILDGAILRPSGSVSSLKVASRAAPRWS